MRNNIAIIMACVLCGCAAQPTEQTFGPNGKPASKVSCQGVPNEYTGCYAKAGEVCGSKGYTVIEKANGISLNSMLIECKG